MFSEFASLLVCLFVCCFKGLVVLVTSCLSVPFGLEVCFLSVAKSCSKQVVCAIGVYPWTSKRTPVLNRSPVKALKLY